MKNEEIVSISDLISTEIDYVVLLHNIVNGYLREYHSKNISKPRVLRKCEGLMFSNIEQIFEWHRDYFLKALIKYKHNPSEVAQIFIRNAKHFDMYAKFVMNTNISKCLVKKYSKYFQKIQKKLTIKYELTHLLQQPIQRLTHYKVLITQIGHHLRQENLIEDLAVMEEAENTMESVLKKINDYAKIECIQHLEANHGDLLYSGLLNCEFHIKQSLHYVFLFEKFILFTHKQAPADPFSNCTYNICLQVPLGKLELHEMRQIPNSYFFLCSPGLDYNMVCFAEDKGLHQKWLEILRKLLLVQDK